MQFPKTISSIFCASLALVSHPLLAITITPPLDTELNDFDPTTKVGRYVQAISSNTVNEVVTLTNGVLTINGESVDIGTVVQPIAPTNVPSAQGRAADAYFTGMRLETLDNEVAEKQDKLTDAQTAAINSVVDERKTVVTYTTRETATFDIEGEITRESISNIAEVATVKIGTAVTSIGSSAFANLSGLTNVTIPNTVTSIGDYTFLGCSGLTSVTIPNSVTSIGENTFGGCESLTSVTIGTGITSIGDGAFYECQVLTNLTFKGKSLLAVQGIENYPWGISDTSIITTWNDASKEWVEGQRYLTTNDVDKTLSQTGKPADAKATGDTLEQKRDKTDLAVYTYAPWTATGGTIDGHEFVYMDGYWYDGIAEYGLSFASDTGKWELDFGSATVIAEAPEDALTLDFGEYGVFTRDSIYAPVSPADTLAKTSDLEPLLLAQYYPDGSVKSAAEFRNDIKYTFYTGTHTADVKPFCNTGVANDDNSSLAGRVVIPPFVDAQGNPYISDDGTRFKVIGLTSGIPSNYQTALTAIVAPNTMTSIGDWAFCGCTSLVSVSFSAVTSIGDNAFNSCSSLASVSFPATTSIGDWAFGGCTSLVSVSFSAVTSIGDNAFYSCSSLASASFPAVMSIGYRVFHSCSSLASASFPAVTNIGEYAFFSCSSLASASFPAMTSIGNNAFFSCSSLASASFPAVTSIGYGAFFDCDSLVSVSFPAVTSIGDCAFYNCTSLAYIDFGAPARTSVPTLGADAFSSVPNTCKIIVPDSQYDAWTAEKLPDGTTDNPWYSLVTAGYPFLKHSEWEYARRYELSGKQDALSAAQLANIAAVPGKADAADLRYRIAEAGYAHTGARLPDDASIWYDGVDVTENGTLSRNEAGTWIFSTDEDLVAWDDEGSFVGKAYEEDVVLKVNGNTVSSFDLLVPRALADRAVNAITATNGTASIDIAFPAPQEGYSRDFYVGIVSSDTAPTLTLPTDITLVTTIPELFPNATNIIRFTEVDTNAFVAVNISQSGSPSPADDSLLAKMSYSELVAAANGGQLTPGKQYQITNYVATTTQSGTQSANHPFDIIVTATSTNTISEEAEATLHAGDTYFPGGNCNLAAWKVWYSITNDTKRFAWADPTNGKGVIYRMIDEYGNDVPYDFKGIMFQKKIPFYDNSGVATQTNDVWCYTFDGGWSQQGARRQMDFSIDDAGYSNFIFGNKIRPYIVEVTSGGYYLQQKLNGIVSLGYNVEENSFDEGCFDVVLGQKNSSTANVIKNNFGKGCFANEFGAFFLGNEVKSYVNRCRYVFTGTPSASAPLTDFNTIGEACSGIVLSKHNTLNTIENGCGDITFADSVRNVNIANGSKRITIGHDSSGIKIGAFVENVNLGFACYGLDVGTYVQFVNIGANTNGLWRFITIAPGVQYLNLTKADTQNYGQNISVEGGIYGTVSNPASISVEVNKNYHVEYQPINSITIQVNVP